MTPPSGIAGSRLASLAVLQANFNAHGASYLDNFVPFVTRALLDLSTASSVAEVQAAVARRFGLEIPQPAIKSILERAKQHGVRRRDNCFWLEEPVSTFDEQQGVDVLRCHVAVRSGLQQHAAQWDVDLSDSDAEGALSSFIDDHVAWLALASVGTALDNVGVTTDHDVLVASYVEHITRTDPVAYDHLLKLVQGTMLASALYLPDQGALQRKFRNTTLYLDTPVLIRLLGFAGDELQTPSVELVSLAKAYGAEVACLDNTVAELRRVLTGAGQSLRSRGRGRAQPNDVERWLALKGLGPADVERLAASLERSLTSAGVNVKRLPKKRDTDGVADDMRSRIDAAIQYRSEGTLEHDVEALTAVFGLRGGRSPGYLEDARAIFVTTNETLVLATQEQRKGVADRYTWPVAILDHTIATLLWLKSPMRAPELPRQQLAADCYAALRPDGQLWARYVDELRRLAEADEMGEDDVVLLRFSLDAQRELVAQTLGDPDAVSGQTIRAVLDRTLARAKAPVLDELEEAMKVAEASDRRAAALKADAEAAARRAVEAVERAEARVAEQREEENVRAKRRAARLGRRKARRIIKAFQGFVFVAAAGLEIASFLGWSPIAGGAPWWLRIVWGAVGLLAFLALQDFFWTGRIFERWEKRLAGRIEQREFELWREDEADDRADHSSSNE